MSRGPKKLKSPLKANEFYCVKCKGRCVGEDIKLKYVSNSKRSGKVPMLKGKCRKCDCTVVKFIKQSVADRMRRK